MARDESGEHKSRKRKHSHDGQEMPYGAKTLNKDDFEAYKDVFRRYLKEKKDLRIDDIPSSEAYARFKSFVHKWYQ
jgi:hypothetical protein